MDEFVDEQVVENEQQETTDQEKTHRYAGFWMRFWAYLFDVIVIFSINGILLSPLNVINDGLPIEVGFWTLTSILGGIVYYVYFLLMTKYFQQTIGKMIFGLKVIHEENSPLRWSDLLFREIIGRFIYNIVIAFKLLYIVVAISDEKRGIHDMIGHTRVVHVT